MSLGRLSKGTGWMPMGWVRRLSGVTLVMPFYHLVGDAYVPHVSNLYQFRTVAEFTADVEFLAQHFKPVTLQDIVDALNGTRSLPRSCFHLTFDDGFREMHDVVAPILRRAGVSGTFFLTSKFLDGGGLAHHNEISLLLDRIQSQPPSDAVAGRLEEFLPAPQEGIATLRERMLAIPYADNSRVRSMAEVLEVDIDGYVRKTQPHLTSEQVQAMIGQGFAIGGHSHDHPLYGKLTLEEQLNQTRTCMSLLERKFGFQPKAFAFPHNDDGVGSEFFDTVFSERTLEVSFGTSGFVAHDHPRNIERASMEKTSAPVDRILTRQFARAAYHRLRSRGRAEVAANPRAVPGSR
jgi:peptidoglycan/xylan/chitin deacetylase (PgdA/CDA1 family)